jgi:hypothetical protein
MTCGHGHQHLAWLGLSAAGPRDDGEGVRAGSLEALVPDAGEQVGLRPGPLPQQVAVCCSSAAPRPWNDADRWASATAPAAFCSASGARGVMVLDASCN